MVASFYGVAKVQIYLRCECSFGHLSLLMFSHGLHCMWGKTPSTPLEDIVRVGCCVVSKEVVINAENHHLMLICLKLSIMT